MRCDELTGPWHAVFYGITGNIGEKFETVEYNYFC